MALRRSFCNGMPRKAYLRNELCNYEKDFKISELRKTFRAVSERMLNYKEKCIFKRFGITKKIMRKVMCERQ